MARKLFISGIAGIVFISDATISDSVALYSPISARDHLYFHTNLPYIQIKQKVSPGNVTFPAQARGISSWSDGSKGCGGLC